MSTGQIPFEMDGVSLSCSRMLRSGIRSEIFYFLQNVPSRHGKEFFAVARIRKRVFRSHSMKSLMVFGARIDWCGNQGEFHPFHILHTRCYGDVCEWVAPRACRRVKYALKDL